MPRKKIQCTDMKELPTKGGRRMMIGGGVGWQRSHLPRPAPGQGEGEGESRREAAPKGHGFGGGDTGTTHRDRPTPGWASTATTPVGRCRQTDPWQGHTGTLLGGGRGAPQGSGSVLSAPRVLTKTPSGAGVPQVCSEHTPPHATCPPHGGLQLLLPPPVQMQGAELQGGSRGGATSRAPTHQAASSEG